MIIGVCGFIGSGKDTVADYLVNIHHFRRESFANSLKDAVADVFGWDRDMLEGRTRSSRDWREQRDEWWSNRLGQDITPRWVLQYWGTEVIRRGFHDDMWVASLENRLLRTTDDIVISDCRFPNEIRAIKNAGGLVVRVRRGSEPDWYKSAENFMAGQQKIGWSIGKHDLEQRGIHASEYSWIGTDFDAVLDNTGTMDQLYQQLNGLVLNHPVATEDQISVAQ